MSLTSGRFRRQLRARSGAYRFFSNTHFNRFIAIRASHFYYRAFDRFAKFLAAHRASSIIFHWLNPLYPLSYECLVFIQLLSHGRDLPLQQPNNIRNPHLYPRIYIQCRDTLLIIYFYTVYQFALYNRRYTVSMSDTFFVLIPTALQL